MQTFHAYPFLNTEWDSVSLQIWENAVFTGDSSWYYPHMTSPFNRLYFIMEGEIYLENEKGRNLLRSGHMYLVPAGSCYTYGCADKVRKFYVHFNTELLPGIDLFGELDTILSLPFEKPLLDKIFAEMKKESLSGLLHLKAIFWQIICDFFESSSPDTCQYLHKFRGVLPPEGSYHLYFGKSSGRTSHTGNRERPPHDHTPSLPHLPSGYRSWVKGIYGTDADAKSQAFASLYKSSHK